MSRCSANSVDPDQTPRSVASDLDLHSLQLSVFWDARYKWVNGSIVLKNRHFFIQERFNKLIYGINTSL